MEKRNWQRFIFLFIVLVVVIWIGNNKITEWKMEKRKEVQASKERKERREEMERLVSQMASKYNAINNWHDLLDKGNVYSFEVEKALKPEDGRPILITVLHEDIIKKDDKYFANFHLFSNGIKYLFSLECSHGQVSQLLEHKSDRIAAYAVIAHINSVQKQQYSTDEGKLEEGFLLNGQCVDLVYLQDGFWFYLKKRLKKNK